MNRLSALRTVLLSAVSALVLAACGADSLSAPPPAGGKPVASVAVIAAEDTLTVGGQVTFLAEPRAADGEVLDSPVTWMSQHQQFATVTSAGVVKALAPGAATIVATAGGRSGSAVLTVVPVPVPPPPAPVAFVRLSVDDEVQLPWNGGTQLGAVAMDADSNVLPGRLITWHTTRPDVATVAADGTVQAAGPGTAIVSAISEGVAASVGVRVAQAPVVRVTLDVNVAGLEVGETVFVSASVQLASGQVVAGPVTWTSSATHVAAVTSSGPALAAVQAFGEGNVTITATADTASAAVSLPVTLPPTHDLVYARHQGAQAELYTLPLMGGAPVRINAGSVSRDPSPSPDGTQIAFAVSQTDLQGQQQNDLYIVNRDGLNMRWFTRFAGIEEQPAWSPDGTRILFHATDSVLGSPNIWVMNVDGTGLVNLTAGLPADVTDKRHPAWSPDGTRIAFIASRNGQHKVWVMDADGANAAPLLADAGFDQTPTWSPDGTRIAFARYDAANPANGWDVMIVAAAGGTPARLSLPGDQLVPAWSPDGRYIAVSGTAVAGQGTPQLYTLLPDGSGLRLRTVNPAWGGGSAPAWITRQ